MMVLFFTLTFHLTTLHHNTNVFNAFTIWNSVKLISGCFFCGCTVHNMGLSLVSLFYNFPDKCSSFQIYVCYIEPEVSVNICTGVIWRMKVFQSEIKWAYRILLENLQIVHFYQVSICQQIYFWFHPWFAEHQICYSDVNKVGSSCH